MPRDLRNSSAAAAATAVRREMHEEEVRDARRHREPQPAELLREPRQPVSLWRAAASTWAASSMAAMPAAIAGEETLNGPRMRFSTSAIAAGQ